MANPSPAQVAAEIVALINSRVQSPRQEELEAIVARAIAPTPTAWAAPSGRLTEIDRVIEAIHAAEDAIGDAELTSAQNEQLLALDKPLNPLTEAVWATPVGGLGDLQERALIARHWLRVMSDDMKWGDPAWKHPDDIDDWGERAIAHLIHAVLNFGGALPPATPSTSATMDDPIVKEVTLAVERWGAAIDQGHDEAERDAASVHLDAVARRTWDREPKSPADVVARAILAEQFTDTVDHDTGEIVYLDPTRIVADRRPAVCDTTAEAHLFDAIRKVLGGRRYPRA